MGCQYRISWTPTAPSIKYGQQHRKSNFAPVKLGAVLARILISVYVSEKTIDPVDYIEGRK